MPDKFYLYSTDIDPTTEPEIADPVPSDLVQVDDDPENVRYNPFAGTTSRGCVIGTIGGIVMQDFGAFVGDQRITLEADNALTASQISAIKELHDEPNAEYYFTDGESVWTVRFVRPDGFKFTPNYTISPIKYSYAIQLFITDQMI